MPIEPVKIPQNVQVEDKIIGPISLRQIFIMMIGGGISFASWNAMKAAGAVSMFNLMLAWTPFCIAGAFAFIQVQGISLLKLILLAIEKTEKPAKRTFAPRTGVHINIKSYYRTAEHAAQMQQEAEIRQDKLDKLSSLLDEGAPIDENAEMELEVAEAAPQKDEESSLPVNRDRVKVDKPMDSPSLDISHP